jgi:nucleotide-binding universal stress UspA family protein
MIKSLLVPVDASEYAHSAVEHAMSLAQPYQARLTGLYVLDVRYLEMPPYLDYSGTFEAVPPTVIPLEVMEKYRLKGERILSDFKDTVEKAGLEVETRLEEGVPSQVIADLAPAYDAVVMGKRGEHAKWGRDLLGSMAESVVRRVGSPLLLAEGTPRTIKRMMIMFDGSAPAGRALRLAADLAVHTSARVTVFTADDDRESGEATQREAAAYLESAGLEAELVLASGKAAHAATGLLEKDGFDLVVVGMRGHSALHDLILGSTAEHVMRTVALPVLMVP